MGFNDEPDDPWWIGTKSNEDLNSASIEKIGWRMIHEPDALWARVLRHKYCKDIFELKCPRTTEILQTCGREFGKIEQSFKKGCVMP